MTSIKTALADGYNALKHTSESPRTDAEILLLFVIKATRTFLYSHPETLLTEQQLTAYQALIAQRQQGHPVAHLTQTKEFWSLPLFVTPDTLIPRPATELLVELTLSFFAEHPDAHILDLGTGSGAIALALASERPDWNITAIDKSEAALQVAQQNALHLNLPQVLFKQSDWFKSLPPQSFDAIIANPPYIAKNDVHLQQGDVRFEPLSALTSGVDGLDAIIEIIQASAAYLNPEGFLLIEHGFNQKQAVTELFLRHQYVHVQNFKDYEGNDRVTGGFKPK